ncbi:MAG: RluA family pseudouridine synthase [Pseudomonadota bacterium]|nr:RluA family pseudouridine synthase [Pseudomonadota bacterium]
MAIEDDDNCWYVRVMTETKHKEHIITADETGIRLDRWFKRHFPGLPHGQLQKYLRSGQIRLAGKRVEAGTRLVGGQAMRVPPDILAPPAERLERRIAQKSARTANKLKNLILFEDDDVIVLNKPAGLAVQGGTGLRENLDDMLTGLVGEGESKPKLVHRLDRDTSGVLLLARTSFAAAKLAAAFRHRDTEKAYWAVTQGVPKMDRGRIDAALIKRGERMMVDEEKSEDAKGAVTLYKIMEKAKGQAAFVALWPVTGRTHQLRVHMAYIGTPLLGDKAYGGERNTGNLPTDELGKGLHLHARRLIIPHPRRGTIDATAPLGPELLKTWKWFGFDWNAETDAESE